MCVRNHAHGHTPRSGAKSKDSCYKVSFRVQRALTAEGLGEGSVDTKEEINGYSSFMPVMDKWGRGVVRWC